MDIASLFNMMRIQLNWNPCTLLMEMENGTASLENSLIVSSKVKHTCTVSLLGIYPKEMKRYVNTKP